MNNQYKSMLWAFFSSFFWRLCPYMTLRDIICRKTNPSSIWCWLCVFLQPNTPGSPLITVVLLTTALWVNDPGMNWENHKINKHLVTTTTNQPTLGMFFFSCRWNPKVQANQYLFAFPFGQTSIVFVPCFCPEFNTCWFCVRANNKLSLSFRLYHSRSRLHRRLWSPNGNINRSGKTPKNTTARCDFTEAKLNSAILNLRRGTLVWPPGVPRVKYT